MPNTSTHNDKKTEAQECKPQTCPNCGRSKMYFPTSSMVLGELFFHGTGYGHCLICNYSKELTKAGSSS